MSRKNNLITTSAIISLLLFNTADIKAETLENVEPEENQITTTELNKQDNEQSKVEETEELEEEQDLEVPENSDESEEVTEEVQPEQEVSEESEEVSAGEEEQEQPVVEPEKTVGIEKEEVKPEKPATFSARRSYEQIVSETEIAYRGTLSRATDGINTRPWGTEGYETIRFVGDLVGKNVKVSREAITARATWSYVEVIGTDIAGWIDKSALTIESITSEKNVKYDAELVRSSDGINTRPWGTEGFQTIRRVGDWSGRTVRVLKEAVTPRATWAFIEVTGTDVSGWIDVSGLKKVESVLDAQSISYYGKLTRSGDGINSKPWGIHGFKTLRRVGNWTGKTVRVSQEAVTSRATWSYVEVLGTNVSGWVDKAGLDIETVTSERKISYDARLLRKSDGINTRPFGTPGFETIRTVGDLANTTVKVSREAVTSRATWAYIEIPGTDVAGWIDKAGIKAEEVITSEKDINYFGKLTRSSDGINTKPWGVFGYQTVRRVGSLEGRSVKITREAVTPRATWSYIQVLGTNISGWIDKAGLDVERITSEREVSYDARLLRSGDGINTRPFGTEGYETVRTVGDLVRKEVRVNREATTRRATWAHIEVLGTDITGWIDTAGLENINTYNVTQYNMSFLEALENQMNKGWPQTDLYGGGFKDADVSDVAKYLDPSKFIDLTDVDSSEFIGLIVSTSSLNVRTGPSALYQSLGLAQRNDKFLILDEMNGWYEIDFNGNRGWVSGSYVSLVNQPKAFEVVPSQKKELLQFLVLSGTSGISVNDMNKELKGKGILENTGRTFIEASRMNNINEIYLLSHALLETGNGRSKLATGVIVDEVDGVKVPAKKVYNMFGIQAFDKTALKSGSEYAYKMGWDTPEKAILGGSEWIAKRYINNGYSQDTLYKMKWNPLSPGVHQYATDIGWAVKQTGNLQTLVDFTYKYDLSLRFDIPLYN